MGQNIDLCFFFSFLFWMPLFIALWFFFQDCVTAESKGPFTSVHPSQARWEQEIGARKVKVYLQNWHQAWRPRLASALKNLTLWWPLMTRLYMGKIINHGYWDWGSWLLNWSVLRQWVDDHGIRSWCTVLSGFQKTQSVRPFFFHESGVETYLRPRCYLYLTKTLF